LNVRREQLEAGRLTPGPWLGELKKRLAAGENHAMIGLPDGSVASAEDLAAGLIRITPARKLIYATDIADTASNREKVAAMASAGYCFFCEAAFLAADKKYAELNGHLTARACGEIARNAGVKHLVPFHFSRRYEKKPLQLYEEVKSSFSGRIIQPSFSSY
jgi:ribonuclease BN (tRNA processing enzyme)